MSTSYCPAHESADGPRPMLPARLGAPLAPAASRYSTAADLVAAIRAAAEIAPEERPERWHETRGRYVRETTGRTFPGMLPADECDGPACAIRPQFTVHEEIAGPMLPLPADARVSFAYVVNGARGSLTAGNTRAALLALAERVAKCPAFSGRIPKPRKPAAPAASAPHVTARAMLAERDHCGALALADQSRGGSYFGASGPARPGFPSFPNLYMGAEHCERGGHAFIVARMVASGRFRVLHAPSGQSVDSERTGAPRNDGFTTQAAALAWLDSFAAEESWRAKMDQGAKRAAPLDQGSARTAFLAADREAAAGAHQGAQDGAGGAQAAAEHAEHSAPADRAATGPEAAADARHAAAASVAECTARAASHPDGAAAGLDAECDALAELVDATARERPAELATRADALRMLRARRDAAGAPPTGQSGAMPPATHSEAPAMQSQDPTEAAGVWRFSAMRTDYAPANRPVHVLFTANQARARGEGGQPAGEPIGFYMSEQTYRSIPLDVLATPADYSRHGPLQLAPDDFQWTRAGETHTAHSGDHETETSGDWSDFARAGIPVGEACEIPVESIEPAPEPAAERLPLAGRIVANCIRAAALASRDGIPSARALASEAARIAEAAEALDEHAPLTRTAAAYRTAAQSLREAAHVARERTPTTQLVRSGAHLQASAELQAFARAAREQDLGPLLRIPGGDLRSHVPAHFAPGYLHR